MYIKRRFSIIFFALSFLTILLPIILSYYKRNQLLSIDLVGYEATSKTLDDSCKKADIIIQKNINKGKPIINIKIPKSRAWSKNLVKANIDLNTTMTRKYKKRFNAIINIIGTNCYYPAKIRLSGHNKDHINLNGKNIISSVDIILEKGNINNIKKFKLFLPRARSGDFEIVTTVVLSKLGFLTPRTKLVKVIINNNETEMIIQENPSKELLKFSNKKESAIIGINEELMRSYRNKKNDKEKYSNGLIFPQLINYEWINNDDINYLVSIKGMDLFSNVIRETMEQIQIKEFKSFSDYLLSGGDQNAESVLSQFRLFMTALGAGHSLVNHNRRFYYEPESNSFLPIYYDGNSYDLRKYLLKEDLDWLNEVKEYNLREVDINDINSAILRVKKLNPDVVLNELFLSGINFNKLDVTDIINNLILNLEELKNHVNDKIELNWKKYPHDYYNTFSDEKFGLVFTDDKFNYFLCNYPSLVCRKENINREEAIEILRGRYISNGYKFFYYGKSFDDYKFGKGNVFVKPNSNKSQ